MSSRDKILLAIKENKPVSTALPVVDTSCVIAFEDLATQFKNVLTTIGGVAVEVSSKEDMHLLIEKELSGVTNAINTLGAYDERLQTMSAAELASVDLAVIAGTLAVAENGAIWVNEQQMVNRILPFIAQQLIIVVEKNSIVPTMHHAYGAINVAETGFGAFIAGPSKTADIEQSLVIGAHGPAGLKVILY